MRFALTTLVALMSFSFTTSALAAEDGAAVFEEHCASCHNSLIGGWMTGATDIDDKEDWQPVIVKGIEALTQGTIMGVGEMPPRGKCETCSDEQIRAAVEYIVQQVSAE